ncbi:endonuclease/exonuclease/phosphatase family protein [Tenacibaculum piscium]|uniref:endonuclease/exonuclease/phosphatase family protein n=1 Tax=Tenacibaculum piscium TaxID=1458515 RepID=UPI001EFB51C5|nr:endonuclease/exonuclease/phosphatase family protein [Tenacibaculum piscium]MCG8183383.1 endonuclease/exonuclease/phosphatase family protein [Tenacibaculum piscium]MCG8204433.1 endonuclease/exonuclease/phosphatase family protein [Tenacibaculum piscium]
MKNIFLWLLVSCMICVSFSECFSQSAQKKYKIRTVGFYNLENLFDTVNDIEKNDEASPIMEIKGDKQQIYWDKIDKLGDVILQLGAEKTKTSPAILGVAEVENRKVLEDLVASKNLKDKNYDIIHFDSPDKRGIDVGLLYQKRYFKPIHYQAFNPGIYRDGRKVHTRDILWVAGYLDDELIHILVNHWPSRRGGEAKSRPLREKAAYKVTQIIEKIRVDTPKAKILIMGDFNDDPINSSLKNVLKTVSKKKLLQENDLYNPYENMFRRGFNTLGYRDNINLFDQIIISSELVAFDKKNDFSTFKMFKAGIFNKRFLTEKKGRYKGYPFRSFSYGKYTGGYSDHYPVYLYLIKELDENIKKE